MTDTLNPNVEGNFVRTIASSLNFCVYFLLGLMYQIFFNVASAQLFESETIKNFYGRVQLIIGVFMVFKLAITILQGIMDPEKFMGNKEGFGTIITRVVVALIMLAVIVPINVPDVQNANSYEKYINNNGLLFGTLYSLQDRILSGNTLGRLILGTTDTSEDPDAVDQTGKTEAQIQQEKLVQSANIFSSTILKGFLRINLVPEDERVDDDETNPENWYCGDHLTDDHRTVIDMYNQLDISPIVLLSDPVVKAKCNFNWQASVPGLKLIAGKSKYLFGFNFILALIVGAIFLVLLVAFTVDIAIRSIKLAILRLLAPIPIISYVEPKSAKDGMFASWVKALTSTYLDLFLRLAIVYFVIFIIQEMMVNGIIIDQAGGMVGIISCIFIWIGLFFFARMAPKFIKDVLGLKGPGMSNIGLSGMLSAAGAIRQGGTAFDAVFAAGDATDAQIQAYNQGKAAPGLGMAFNSGRDLAAQMITGDERMNHRKMTRGRWQLREMGITPEAANKLHGAAIQAQAYTERMTSDAERFANDVAAGRTPTYSYVDNNGNHHVYQWADAHGAMHDVTSMEEMSLALSQQKSRSGRLNARDKKVDAELHRTGQARGYRDSVRRPNDYEGSTSLFNQSVTDGYLARRRDRPHSSETGPDDYQYNGPNATGYDITDHVDRII